MNRYDFIKAYNYLTDSDEGDSVWTDLFGSARDSWTVDNIRDTFGDYWNHRTNRWESSVSRPIYEIFRCYFALRDNDKKIKRQEETIQRLNGEIELYKGIRNKEIIPADVVLDYLKKNKDILNTVEDTQLLRISLALRQIKDAESELKKIQEQKEKEKLSTVEFKNKHRLFYKYFEMFQERLNRADIFNDNDLKSDSIELIIHNLKDDIDKLREERKACLANTEIKVSAQKRKLSKLENDIADAEKKYEKTLKKLNDILKSKEKEEELAKRSHEIIQRRVREQYLKEIKQAIYEQTEGEYGLVVYLTELNEQLKGIIRGLVSEYGKDVKPNNVGETFTLSPYLKEYCQEYNYEEFIDDCLLEELKDITMKKFIETTWDDRIKSILGTRRRKKH